MNARALVLVLACGASACAAHIDEAWFDAAGLRAAAAAETDREAVAVALENHERVATYVEGRNRAQLEIVGHRAVLIRAEAGMDLANMRVGYDPKANFSLRARTLLPDGTIRDVTPAETLETDANLGGDKAFKARIFRFPNVSVGSILEVITVKHWESALSGWREDISEAIPVRHYHADVWLPDAVESATKVYRLATDWTKTREGDTQHLALDARDIRADPDEEWTPPPYLRDPFWTLRITAYPIDGYVYPFERDWNEVLGKLAQRLYIDQPKLAPDALRVDLTGERDAVIDRLFVRIRDNMRLTGFDGWDTPRAPGAILSTNGTAAEKTVLLWAALDAAGIHAHFAAVTRTGTNFFDAAQPSTNWLNHLILYIPAVKGPERWLDPSCEACAPGELPFWLRDATAVTFTAKARYGGAEAIAKVLPVTGTLRTDGLTSSRTRLVIDAAGQANVEMKTAHTGAAAMVRLRQTRTWTDVDRRKDAEDAMRARDARGEADKLGLLQCDAQAVKCTRKLQFHVPQSVNVASEQLLLSLSLVGDRFAKLFASEAPRRGPALIDMPVNEHEVLIVALPPGFAVHESPPDVAVTAGGFTAKCYAGHADKDWTWTREMTLPSGLVPVEKFGDLRRVVRAYAACREANLVAKREKN